MLTPLSTHCSSGRHHLLPLVSSNPVQILTKFLPSAHSLFSWPSVPCPSSERHSLSKQTGLGWTKWTRARAAWGRVPTCCWPGWSPHPLCQSQLLFMPAFPATSTMETTQRATWQEGQLGQGHSLMLESVNVQGWSSLGELWTYGYKWNLSSLLWASCPPQQASGFSSTK